MKKPTEQLEQCISVSEIQDDILPVEDTQTKKRKASNRMSSPAEVSAKKRLMIQPTLAAFAERREIEGNLHDR